MIQEVRYLERVLQGRFEGSRSRERGAQLRGTAGAKALGSPEKKEIRRFLTCS